MHRRCNAWTYNNNFTKPNPKLSWKTQKPQNFWKTPKPRSKMHEFMKREKMRTLTKCLELNLGWRTRGWGDLRVRKSFGLRERVLYRERNLKSHLTYEKKTQIDGLRILSRIYQVLNLDRSESVEVLLTAKTWAQWIEISVEKVSMR